MNTNETNTRWKDKVLDPLQEYNTESHRLTIESIQRALIQLLEKKDFRSITIKEIVERAGVSRSAFYRNYQSKEEVLQSILYDSFAKTAGQIRQLTNPGSPKEWQKIIEQIITQCADMYTMMTSDAWQGGTMLEWMNEYQSDMLSSIGMKDTYQDRFWIGGMYNIIQYWLDTGMKETPAELSGIIMNCIRR